MDPEQAHYDAALGRITVAILVLVAAGSLFCGFWRGWTWGLGFLLGAAASHLNFRWLQRIVEALGPAPRVKLSGRFAVVMGLRYLALAAGAYVIVNFTSLSLPAALAGLFVPALAVILEIVFELVYAASH
ncbi:MAG TPA: ATP synthase subunit I [Bryobacteraceae bacterium]|nr:ATP synthase subunit I [Bryobacteraceae bacterium]